MAIDYAVLRTAILSTPACAPHIVTNDMPKQNAYSKDWSIAGILNAPSGIRVVEDFCNEIEIMARLGPATGAAILDKLDTAALTNSALKRAMRAIQSDRGIDLGHAETRAIIDQLVAGAVLTSQEGTLLKGLAERPSSIAYNAVGQEITWSEVSIALRGNHEFTPGGV